MNLSLKLLGTKSMMHATCSWQLHDSKLASEVAGRSSQMASAAGTGGLQGLRMSELMKAAAAAGVSADEIADAQDEARPKDVLIGLIMKCPDPREELGALKNSALMKRALAAGVSQDAVAEAQDADSPRDVLIDIVVVAEGTGGDGGAAPPSGGGAQQGPTLRLSPTARLPATKAAWDEQQGAGSSAMARSMSTPLSGMGSPAVSAFGSASFSGASPGGSSGPAVDSLAAMSELSGTTVDELLGFDEARSDSLEHLLHAFPKTCRDAAFGADANSVTVCGQEELVELAKEHNIGVVSRRRVLSEARGLRESMDLEEVVAGIVVGVGEGDQLQLLPAMRARDSAEYTAAKQARAAVEQTRAAAEEEARAAEEDARTLRRAASKAESAASRAESTRLAQEAELAVGETVILLTSPPHAYWNTY
jgi:hypothetical protein